MFPVFVIMTGGVWLSESRVRMEQLVSWKREGKLPPEVSPQTREEHVHCVVGQSGYAFGAWPKRGLYCYKCSCFFVSTSDGDGS